MPDLPDLDDVICAIVRQCGPRVTASDIETILAWTDLHPSIEASRRHVAGLLESGRLVQRGELLFAPDPELYEFDPCGRVVRRRDF